ncbi:hypothetical protein BZA05DRAFT_419697 [Tricharina praecox]|uniref:uncharacterized protein n=1 Tax=Tricharina praecox TaxID=43433 RepID=UPI00222081F0|nr:uncharacterized protein BZA05DRAFT_419697 [Tricharina praecox]KAI5849898.1 hypothetical protein BZA05DRAFT_419697 [Tricharina praecox]
MSNDIVVSSRLPEWRRLWCNWRGLLTECETSLLQSMSWISNQEKRAPDFSSDRLPQLKDRLLALEADRKRLAQRIVASFEALMSTMSIIESRNAVSQGESISKLTELAFIFIPLSFATSFFGMEIKEWEVNKPRIGHFWGFASGLLLGAYFIRLAIRSTFIQGGLKKFKRAHMETWMAQSKLEAVAPASS